MAHAATEAGLCAAPSECDHGECLVPAEVSFAFVDLLCRLSFLAVARTNRVDALREEKLGLTRKSFPRGLDPTL